MKKYKQLLDIVLLLGLSAIAILAAMPDRLVMPTSIQMLLLSAVLGLLAIFLVFFWREQPDDEREMQNQALASRGAYTVGSLVLLVALIVQSSSHNLDPVVPITLFSMIATKIIIQRSKDGQ